MLPAMFDGGYFLLRWAVTVKGGCVIFGRGGVVVCGRNVVTIKAQRRRRVSVSYSLGVSATTGTFYGVAKKVSGWASVS